MAFDIAPHWNSIQPWKVQMPTSIHRNLTNIHCTRWEQTQLHNNIPIGKFLTVQGLRLHTSNADSKDLIPGLGTKIPYASQCGQIERNKEINNNNKKECAYYIIVACLLGHVRLFVTPWTIAPWGSYTHGIFQARILEWVATYSSRGSSPCRDQPWVSCISCIDRIHWYTVTRGKPHVT